MRDEGNKRKLNEGLQLATGPWKHLCEDLVEQDQYRASLTALLLENTYKFYGDMTEDTRVANVGVFDKFAMPIIRAVFPNLIATDIVSVQPMDGPVSLIFFLETRYALTKGTAKAGQTNLSPLTGHNSQYQYTSENVDSEQIGDGTGSQTAFTANLAWVPVRPGSVTVTAGSVIGTDNGDGSITGTGIAGSSTINYTTGAIVVNFSAAPTSGLDINVTYDYNSEGNDHLPQIDLMLSHAPVQAKPHKLRARWSVEAATDLKAVHGLDAEQELMAHLAEELRFEIDRAIIQDLFRIADSTSVAAWDSSAPAGIPYYQHQLTFINTLVYASNVVFKKTKRAAANWLVCGVGVANIIEALPNFKPTNIDGAGVVHMGTLNGRWEVYKDPWMPDYKGIMGYRGTSFADAGYVYAPYVPLYRTPTIYLDDMVGKVGLMSRYGKKLVNPDFFVQIEVTP